MPLPFTFGACSPAPMIQSDSSAVCPATGETAFLGQARGSRVAIVDEVLGRGVPVISAPVGSFVPASAGALGKVLAGQRMAVDHGEYLEGVNAVAATVPGGLVWVAGFAGRFEGSRLPEVTALLERLTCE